jgi:hypothetical protein
LGLVAASCACLLAPVAGAAGAWSARRVLASGCALAGGPQVAFPSEGPTLPTGAGAIVWASEAARCKRAVAAATHSFEVSIAPLGASERPGPALRRTLPGVFSGELGAFGADFGQVAVAAGTRGAGARDGAAVEVLQGRAAGVKSTPVMVGTGLPFVMTRAYLGDVAVARLHGDEIDVRVERWDKKGFEHTRVVPVGRGPVTAMALTMDYRSDILLAWQQSGSIFARVLRAHGSDDPTQRLGASEPDPQLQALVSDNNHGMVAWSSTAPPAHGGAPVTTTYIDISGLGVRFGAPRVVTSFSDPAEVGRSAGSLALVRIADENVQMAWTTAEDGRYEVRSAPAVYAASPAATTLLSDPSEDAVLASLAPGPANEAIALWTSAPRRPPGAGTPAESELWSARTTIVPRDHVVVASPEVVASSAPIAEPTIAVDPANDEALAAWYEGGSPASIDYAVSPGVAGYRPHPPTPVVHVSLSRAEWMKIALAAGASAAAQALAAMSG